MLALPILPNVDESELAVPHNTALPRLFARISCNTFLESLKHTDQPWVVFVSGAWNFIKNCLNLLCYVSSAGYEVHTWDNGYDSRVLWTFWIFKQQPYFALEVVGRKRFLFFFDKTLVFPEEEKVSVILLNTLTVSSLTFNNPFLRVQGRYEGFHHRSLRINYHLFVDSNFCDFLSCGERDTLISDLFKS